MKFKEIILGTFILLILFFVLLTVFPEPIHYVLYGKYVDGSVAVTALHSGNNIIITNQGGPDLSNTMYIKVLNNNKSYPLDLEIGSNLIVPYQDNHIIAVAGIKTGFMGSKMKDWIILDTYLD